MKTQMKWNTVTRACGGVMLAALCLLIAGCGGGNGTASVNVSGAVAKGAVAGAQVDIYAADGVTLIASGIVTDANGNWSATIPSGAAAVIAMARGGSYIDEYTNLPTAAGSMQCMFAPTANTNVAISPLSNAMTKTARAMVTAGKAPNIGAGLAQAKAEYVNMLGFDPVSVLPPSPSQIVKANANQLKYAALLGGVSKLVDDSYSAIAVGDPSVTPFSLVTALIDDFAADGQFDGIGAGGVAITVGQSSSVTAALPGGGGSAALGNAMNQYLGSAHRPAELAPANFTPPVIAPSNIVVLVTPPVTGGAVTIGGTLSLSGDSVLPTTVVFGAPKSVVSMPGFIEQWTWQANVTGGTVTIDVMNHLGSSITLKYTRTSGWSDWVQPSFTGIVIDPLTKTIVFSNVALPGAFAFPNQVPGQGAPVGVPITTTVTVNGTLAF